MNPIKYSHYGVTQKQIQALLQKEFNQYKFDNSGQLLNGRTIKVEVTLDHPLIVLSGMVLFGSGNNNPLPELNSMFPRISVVDASHRESNTTIGQGLKEYSILTTSQIKSFKDSMGTMKNRMDIGMIITDEQVNNMISLTESLGGSAILQRQEIMQEVTFYISVWCTTVDERIFMTQIAESTLLGLKSEFVKMGFKNPNLNTDTGLVNSNFARMLYGAEMELTGLNTITNYTLLNMKPLSAYKIETFPKFLKFGDENFDPYEVWEKEENE